MTDILQAARSYYGLSDTESCATQLYTNQAGQICVAFEIPLSNEDFAAIVKRMQNIQQPDRQPDTAIIEGPTVEAMREAYNALSKAEKGRYGSFARFMAEVSNEIIHVEDSFINGMSDIKNPRGLMAGMAAEGRQVVHVDAPEEPEPVSMDAVWLRRSECTDAQITHSSDSRWAPGTHDVAEFLVQWAMLTDEQKQKAKESDK